MERLFRFISRNPLGHVNIIISLDFDSDNLCGNSFLVVYGLHLNQIFTSALVLVTRGKPVMIVDRAVSPIPFNSLNCRYNTSIDSYLLALDLWRRQVQTVKVPFPLQNRPAWLS